MRLNQVQEFDQVVGLTGLTITKLDGTAKGGVLFNIASRSHVPIRFIGVGEKIDDLRPFIAKEFVAALFQTYFLMSAVAYRWIRNTT
jgi:fused signal recognition particle receptor